MCRVAPTARRSTRVGRRENVFVAEPAQRPRQQRRRAVEPQRFVLEEPRQLFAGGGNSVSNEEGDCRVDGLVPDTPIQVHAFLGDQRSNIVAIEVGPGRTWADIVLRLGS